MNANRDTRKIPRQELSYAWYTVGVLTLAYTFSYIDRSILSLMVGPVRADLGLSDTRFSLLHGLAFAVFYTIMGIPIARLADAGNRKHIIAIGIFFWSLMTAVCGVCKNFWQLFLARIGVGLGEAALSPAAYSIIADSFPREKLGKALGIYAVGVFLGIGLSFIIGGTAIDLVASSRLNLPGWLQDFQAWQLTFFLVGLPGIPVALLALTIWEPPRKTLANTPLASTGAGSTQSIPIRKVMAYLRQNLGTYLCHFAGFSMITLVFNGILSWAPEFFIRTYGLPRREAGFYLGTIVLVFGSLGIICGGLFSDRLTRRGYPQGPMLAGLVGAALLLPFSVLATITPSVQLSLALFCPLLFFASFPFSPAAAALQIVTPNRMRAQISAVYLFVVNLTGIGMGATVTALITDYVFRDDAMLRYSMSLVGGLGGTLACVILWVGIRYYRQSIIHLHRGGTADL